MSSRKSLLSLRIISRALTLPRCRVGVQGFFCRERGSDSFHRTINCESGCGTLGHVVDGCIGMSCKNTKRIAEFNVFNVWSNCSPEPDLRKATSDYMDLIK